MRTYLYILLVFAVMTPSLGNAKRIDVSDEEVAEIKRPNKVAANGNDMRTTRRVGVGLAAAGPLGLGGINLELNFNDKSGMLVGFGGGPGYQAFNFQYKRVLAGEWLLPYIAGGFARWQNFGPRKPIQETTPGIISERFMTAQDKIDGKIDEYLIYPAFGLQFVQLTGDWAGFSVFAELDVLLDVEDFTAGPTGGVGMTYYF